MILKSSNDTILSFVWIARLNKCNFPTSPPWCFTLSIKRFPVSLLCSLQCIAFQDILYSTLNHVNGISLFGLLFRTDYWVLFHSKKYMAATGLELTTTYFVNGHWTIWLNVWVFVHKVSGFGFDSRCSHFIFRYCACFEQGVPWHSGNLRV